MNKKEFIKSLKNALKNSVDQAELINYYNELIDEAVLNGEHEIDVVARLGSVSEIVSSLEKEEPNTINKPKEKRTSRLIYRVIGLIGYFILLSLLISIVFNGGVSLFANLVETIQSNKITVTLYYSFQMLIAIAVIIIASSVFTNILKLILIIIKKIRLSEGNK